MKYLPTTLHFSYNYDVLYSNIVRYFKLCHDSSYRFLKVHVKPFGAVTCPVLRAKRED